MTARDTRHWERVTDDLMSAYDDSVAAGGNRLRALCAEHPALAHDLTAFALTLWRMDTAPEPPPATPEELERLHQIGMTAVANVMAQYEARVRAQEQRAAQQEQQEGGAG